MRILLITEYLPASDQAEITGGVEAYAHYVGGHLRTEHEVTVVSRPTDGTVWDEASIASIPGRLWFLLKAVVQGLRAPADVVVATTYVVHPIAWLGGKLRRRPVVFWYPDVLIGTWRNGQFGRVAGIVGELAERIILRLPGVDRFIAISQSTADKLVAHGIPAEKVTVIACGFDQAVVDAVTPEPAPTGEARVTVVGRLVPYKRVDLVIEAMAILAPERPDLRLVVIGQGPERERLAAQAAELGIADRVELHQGEAEVVAGVRVMPAPGHTWGHQVVVWRDAQGTCCYTGDVMPTVHHAHLSAAVGGRSRRRVVGAQLTLC